MAMRDADEEYPSGHDDGPGSSNARLLRVVIFGALAAIGMVVLILAVVLKGTFGK